MLPSVCRLLIGLSALGTFPICFSAEGEADAAEGGSSTTPPHNKSIEERIAEQERQIDELAREVKAAAERIKEQEKELEQLRRHREPARRQVFDQILLGGEGAVAFMDTGARVTTIFAPITSR